MLCTFPAAFLSLPEPRPGPRPRPGRLLRRLLALHITKTPLIVLVCGADDAFADVGAGAGLRLAQ
eukprot:4024632-Pyramimonas_sp.AAC.1